jgi:hypothetical protein
MTEATQRIDEHEQLTYPVLVDLYKHFWSVVQSELSFCHQYLNFYSGLLSAILAATLAGLLNIKFGGLHELILLFGPLLMIVLAYNGYNTINTFYRRFVQAWVTTLNLESMLHIRYSSQPTQLPTKPRFISSEESFIPVIEDARIKGILQAKEEKRAEQVTKELSKSRKGTTLANAKITFTAFTVAAAILLVVIILTAAYPNL